MISARYDGGELQYPKKCQLIDDIKAHRAGFCILCVGACQHIDGFGLFLNVFEERFDLFTTFEKGNNEAIDVAFSDV